MHSDAWRYSWKDLELQRKKWKQEWYIMHSDGIKTIWNFYVKTCGCSPLTLIGLFIAYLDISFVCNIVINACNQIKKPVISGTMLEKWQAWNIDLSSWHLFCRSPISTPFLFISHNIIILLSNDVSACFFVCKYYCFTLSRKNKFKVRDSKVRSNRFCQIITVWSHFLKFKITH